MTPFCYAPSGRADWGRFLPRAVAVVAVAGLLATGVAVLAGRGWHFVPWTNLAVIVVLSVLAGWVVLAGHCRNRVVAALFGLAVGGVAAALPYHIDQCRRWGVGWERFDRLPGYVAFRMETDEFAGPSVVLMRQVPAPPRPGVRPWRTPDSTRSLQPLLLGLEAAVVVLFPAWTAAFAAGGVYSERSRRWYERADLILTPRSAKWFWSALDAGTLARWAEAGATSGDPAGDHVVVGVWSCPAEGAGPAERDILVGTERPTHRLDAAEAAVLAKLLPGGVPLAEPAEEPDPEARERDTPEGVARLTAVPGPHVGRAKNWGVKWWGQAKALWVTLGPAVALVGYLAGLIALTTVVGNVAVPLLLLVPPFAGLYHYLTVWLDPTNDAAWRSLVRHYRRVVQEQARRRPDALFPADHPDAVYVEMMPRRAWAVVGRYDAECEGLLLLMDDPAGRLLGEGDRFRYVIPYAAVESCRLVEMPLVPALVGTAAGFYAVVLTVRTAAGVRELPLAPCAGLPGGNRHELAAALHDRLAARSPAAGPGA